MQDILYGIVLYGIGKYIPRGARALGQSLRHRGAKSQGPRGMQFFLHQNYFY